MDLFLYSCIHYSLTAPVHNKITLYKSNVLTNNDIMLSTSKILANHKNMLLISKVMSTRVLIKSDQAVEGPMTVHN